MLLKLKRYLRKYKLLKKIVSSVYKPIKNLKNKSSDKKLVEVNLSRLSKLDKDDKKIFYCGRPLHSNLGDQAQAYCILKWFEKNFQEYSVVEVNSRAVVFGKEAVVAAIEEKINPKDLIFFQSGYCTTDMHGVDEKMHRIMIESFKDNVITSLPQTINFEKEAEASKSSRIYSAHEHLIVLARDEISFGKAQKLFAKNKCLKYPDIVTSLISTYPGSKEKSDILFCIRNDGETYYDYNQILKLKADVESRYGCRVDITDTTIAMEPEKIVADFENILYKEFDKFSKYKLIVTDRYHGTIFSLVSKTPVIVLQTNDYKVSSGVDWFKGEYPDYIAFAEGLDKVFDYADRMMDVEIEYTKVPTMYQSYYDELAKIVYKELEG